MAFFAGYTILRSLYNHHRPISSFYKNKTAAFHLVLYWQPSFASRRWLSTGTESTQSEFACPNAYELLGVSETSSFVEIKASFRKLAKETHPDVAQSQDHSSASKRFIQILAAYAILSDSEKRAHYDRYLLSQRTVIQSHPRQDYVRYNYELHRAAVKHMEVVEWLEWYRDAIKDILSEKRVVAGSGYFDVLERDFYSAIHAAYYGPEIESMDLLPDCFEAEERSDYGTSEVLHLVSGRDLFGMVCISEKVPQLSHGCKERLTSFGSCLCPTVANIGTQMNSGAYDFATSQSQAKTTDYQPSDAYKDLELYILGNRVAVATRVLPTNIRNGIDEKDLEDQIHVYLTSPGDAVNSNQEIPGHTFSDLSDGSRFHLGTITGLGTSPDEGSCTVYSNNAVKTHVIMKHRTLLVKHMHWYQVGDEVSACECRCSRARLPPSKYWLFEPRCGMHDIGGWYVETFGRDKKGRTVPSQRFWDGLPTNEQYDKKLHPAVYLLALAYRTLDIEVVRRRKQAIIKDIFEPKMFSILSWCKKLI